MKLVIISSSPFIPKDNSFFAYSPMVKELAIWARHSDSICFFCPIWQEDKGLLISKIEFPIYKLYIAKEFNIKSLKNFLKAFQYSFSNFFQIFKAMSAADHIHIRCPGNIGLMACIVQILFPGKPKTAKYAGNWDPRAKQPVSYKLQRWILSNTFLTKNMRVLVYGEWPRSSKNIRPFFTASYKEDDKLPIVEKSLESVIKFIFVGTFAPGKRALYAIKLIEKLHQLGHNVELSLYGHGRELETLGDYITQHNIMDFIRIKGNQSHEIIKNAYMESHFVVLPSKSEGWPKVIAEGMFWGCVPITTKVSCLKYMLEGGKRGILLNMDFDDDINKILSVIKNQKAYREMALYGSDWSRKYTLDLFETEIKGLLN